MPKRSKPKSVRAKSWWEKLEVDDVRTAYEDAVIDAYGDDEQHLGLVTMIENELVFPFPAVVMDEEVSIVGFEWPQDDAFGLDFLFERKARVAGTDRLASKSANKGPRLASKP